MSHPVPPLPDFSSPAFLIDHIARTMNFYHPNCMDPKGGFYHFYKDSGEVYDRDTRHLVSSTRFIFTYSMAWQQFRADEFRGGVRHGLAYLRDVHRQPATGGYAWLLDRNGVADDTNHCYGLAFVMLAYAKAIEAGIDEARGWLAETWDLLENRFWDPRNELYADEATAYWRVSNYRGQNANMHACEALIAAFEATGEQRYLTRASLVADHIVNRQAALTGGLVWEHYHADWSVDWEYNKGDRSNIFRPWGFQPGHQVEWAKLLLILDRHDPAAWRLPRARALFDRAMALGWDAEHGGIVYGTGLEDEFYDDDKYFWVQAEALATAALLAQRTGEAGYQAWYERIWTYAWQHFVDHREGAWFRILRRDNSKIDDLKSPAGKVDYHTMGACYDVLKALALAASRPAS
ncbi:MAG: AGE family epimerase/isomerase [Janthinobacterium lividum]